MAFIEAQSLSKTYTRLTTPKSGGISRLWKREKQQITALTGPTSPLSRESWSA